MGPKVGFFPSNNSLWVLRHRGILERSLPNVEWVDFRSLPQGKRPGVDEGLPSAHGDHLAGGGYDFIGTGSTPPVTAQGRGHDIVYVATSAPRHGNGRLLVKEDSPISSVEDLAGKRIGIGHGSWQTTLLLFALDRAGLRWQDVVPVDTYGTDAAQAFLDGDIDAWVGAYPFLSRVEASVLTRELVPTEGLFSHRSLWFTRRDFVDEHWNELAAIVDALQESDSRITSDYRGAAALFAADDNGDVDAWENALRTRPFGLYPVSDEFVVEQQRAADLLHASGLLPRKVTVADAVRADVGELVRASARRAA